MKKLLLLPLFLLATLALAWGQATVLEDFEGGAKLTWITGDDAPFSVVDNPPGGDTLMINTGGQVGSFTKVDGIDYNFLLATLDAPLDLTTNNQFRMMVKSPKECFLVFKVEGGTGSPLNEVKKYIGVANQWIELTFNLSNVPDKLNHNKIVMFFDAGVKNSSDTFLFDNIVVEPSGDCNGVAKDPDLLDDFECQRNISYGLQAYFDLEPVENPDPSGINTSAGVGQYTDRGSEYEPLVLKFGEDIKLAERSIFKLKLWAPVAGNLLVKLEGGDSGIKEIPNQITELNQWIEVSVDFNEVIGGSYTRIVLFFNAGVLPGPNDVYYIDDIQLVAPPPPPMGIILEDFEDGPKMTWEGVAGGTFGGAIANPDANEPNTSASVGKFTKGASKFGGVKAFLPLDFSISEFPQINLQVWPPAGATSFTMTLNSVSTGAKSVKRPIETTQEWVDLVFTFEDQTVDDFESVELVFDEDLEAEGSVWYFDNLTQGVTTVDPCDGVEPIANIIDDFDCQRNAAVTVNDGGTLNVVRNPDPSGINMEAADLVGEYTDPLTEWSFILWDNGQAFDMAVYNQLNVKIWAPATALNTEILFKVEGNGQQEVRVPVTTTEEWVQYSIDFSASAGTGRTKVLIFTSAGQAPAQQDVYYLDDLEWKRAPYTNCVATFESPELSLPPMTYFGGSTIDVTADNPYKEGINTSDKVGKFVERIGGDPYYGMFGRLEAPIDLGTGPKTMRMKVWMDHAAVVALNLQDSPNGAPNSGDVKVDYTEANQWQELTFSYPNAPDDAQYRIIAIIMDFETVQTEEMTYYFDDITVGDGDCALTTSIFSPTVERLRVFPNPAADNLTIQNAEGLGRFVIFNALGQRLQTVQTSGQANFEVELHNLRAGVYYLNGYDEQGRLRANAKFVKQ